MHASSLYIRVKTKDREKDGKSPKHREVDQSLFWGFTVTFPLGIREHRTGKRQKHKRQRDKEVK